MPAHMKLLQWLCLLALFVHTRGSKHEWTVATRCAGEQSSVSLLLRQRNLDELHRRATSVSNPTSKEYGQYWSLDQLTELLAPAHQDVEGIVQWITSRVAVTVTSEATSGYTVDGELSLGGDHDASANFPPLSVHVVRAGHILNIEGDCRTVERLFGVEMHVHNHKSLDHRIVRILHGTHDPASLIPSSLGHIIHSIHGLTDFPAPQRNLDKSKRRTSSAAARRTKQRSVMDMLKRRSGLPSAVDSAATADPESIIVGITVIGLNNEAYMQVSLICPWNKTDTAVCNPLVANAVGVTVRAYDDCKGSLMIQASGVNGECIDLEGQASAIIQCDSNTEGSSYTATLYEMFTDCSGPVSNESFSGVSGQCVASDSTGVQVYCAPKNAKPVSVNLVSTQDQATDTTVITLDTDFQFDPDSKTWYGVAVLPLKEHGFRNFLPIETTAIVALDDGTTQQSTLVFTTTHMITPKTLRELYNIPTGITGDSSVTQAVTAFAGQSFSQSDLDVFTELMGRKNQQVNVWGFNDPTSTGGEATLDVQYVLATGSDVPTTFWSIGNSSNFLFIKAFLEEASNTPNIPDVISISYGLPTLCWAEAGDPCSSGVTGGMGGDLDWLEQEWKKLAMRGITVLVASGDDGVADTTDDSDNVAKCATKFKLDYPGSSPWVTDVGSSIMTTRTYPMCIKGYTTKNATYTVGHEPFCEEVGEAAATQDARPGSGFDTGGGFSFYFPMPDYQQDVVPKYWDQPKTRAHVPAGATNPAGRGAPDIAVVGDDYFVYQDGDVSPTGGTSSSAPALAGMISLLNVARLRSGQAKLGFLNPLLYKLAAEHDEVFNDVLIGENRCTRGIPSYASDPFAGCCEKGLLAAPGWDPLTGVGTPNFEALMNAVLNIYPGSKSSAAQQQFKRDGPAFAFLPVINQDGGSAPANTNTGDSTSSHGGITAGLVVSVVANFILLGALLVVVRKWRQDPGQIPPVGYSQME